MLQSLIDLQRKIDSGWGTVVLGEGEGLLVDHLTLKNPAGIRFHLLVKGKEEDTIGITIGMNLRNLELLKKQ